MVLDVVGELSAPDIGVRLDAIAKLAKQPSDARAKLAAILLEPRSGTCARVWAMVALCTIRCDTGDVAEQALVHCVDDPDAAVRRTAIDTLGHLRLEAAASRIAAHLSDHDAVERWFGDDSTPSQAARRALRAIRSPEALALLGTNEEEAGGSGPSSGVFASQGALQSAMLLDPARRSLAERRAAADISDGWYYCDAEKNDERCDGPVSFDRLMQLIRTGAIPHDALVSLDKDEWVEADTIEEILRAIPLDRERIIREYIEYGETEDPEWGWASDRMYSVLENVPELAWDLIVELIERAPSDNSLSFFAAGPLEELLSKYGAQFIERVEQRTESNAKFRRAVGMLRRLGMTDDVWDRVRRIAQPTTCELKQ